MTSHPKSTTKRSDSEQCMLYLAGDLPDSQSATFEQKLADSPELAAELLNQSVLLCHIADSTTTMASPLTAAIPSPNSTVKYPRRWIEILLGVAACLAFVATIWVNRVDPEKTEVAIAVKLTGKPAETSTDDVAQEENLIAQAWASTNRKFHFSDSTFETENDRDADALPMSTLDDSSLSWVSIAIESGAPIDG